MKKILALLVVILVLVSAPVALSTQLPRQVDPSTAPSDSVYGQGLYLFYGALVASLASGNFTAARQLLNQTGFIHLPPEIANAVNSFNGLLNSTSNLLITASHQIANASEYVSTGRLDSARTYLQGALSNLNSANATITQLFGAAPNLAAITGIPPSLLLQKLQPLDTLYRADAAEANGLLKAITGATRLQQTAVSLTVRPAAIETGSNVTVSGTLTLSTGAPLGVRYVTIYFANETLGKTLTASSGAYSAALRTPYYYQGNASLFASYLPAGNDTLAYAPSTSLPVNLNVTFSSPAVSVSLPKSVDAGQKLQLDGSLHFGGVPLPGYNVTISGFQVSPSGTALSSSNKTRSDGSFSIDFAVPSTLAQGTYTLSLVTAGNRTIGPSTFRLSVFVVKETPTVTSSVPAFAFAGFPVTISGSATANNTGIQGAKVVNISPDPTFAASTSSGGEFTFTVAPPITTPNGVWNYSIGVYPVQSWISPSQVSVRVFVINPLVLLFPASSLGLLFLAVSRRRPRQLSAQPRVETAEPAKSAPVPVPPSGLAGIYASAVELVERSTSVMSLPQMTVREYLGAVKGKLKGIGHLEYISSALESQLYGGGVSPEVEGRAAAELDALRGELES